MEIKTKFDIDQSVYVIRKYLRDKSWFEEETYYEIKQVDVIGVYVNIMVNGEMTVFYELNENGVILSYNEEDIYSSKEEAEQKLKKKNNKTYNRTKERIESDKGE